ncbi:MAG: hypothetical protein SVR94_10780, partial [Pseudomonadota bacterium]|nr:hypothetical protein [Pseudomonadota bacterium]
MPSFTQLMITGLQKLSPYVNNIADFFVIIFIMLALWALIGRGSRFAYIAPSLITSLSFIGVFLSFAIGLSVFSPNFENSVTYLLN